MATTNATPPSALTVARFLRYLGGRDHIDNVDQYKIQKALYFCQCYSLALRGVPLFDDEMQAWINGPVVPCVHREYTQWGKDSIDPCPAPSLNELGEADRAFVESLWYDMKELSGKDLRDKTHESAAWKLARGSLPRDSPSQNIVKVDDMLSEFQGIVDSWRTVPG